MHSPRATIVSGFLFCVVINRIGAQQISQLGLSNYGAVHSVHFNPSFSAYSKYHWQINLAGFWVNANNNYLSLRIPYSAYRIPNRIPRAYLTESGNPAFRNDWLHENLNGKPKHVAASSDVYAPSAVIKAKDWSFGLFTQGSANLRGTRIPENLAHALYKELDSSQGAFSQFNSLADGGFNKLNAFSISGNSRINLGVNVSRSFKLDWGRQLLLGVSIKKVWGMPGFYLNSSGIEVKTYDANILVFSPARIQLITYGEESIGKGWGTDIGATYVFHKKDFKRNNRYAKTRTQYFSKIGFAILDIGRIRYKNAKYSEVNIDREIAVNFSSEYGNSIYNGGDYEAAANEFLRDFGSYREYSSDLIVGLPTRVFMSSDFQLKKHLFVAGAVSQSLRKRMSHHGRYQSYMMVAPRLEYRYFEVSVPALLEYDYRSLRVGASVRLGPVFIGSNSLVSFLYTRAIRDADIFAGISFGNLSEFSFRKLAKSKRLKKSRSRQSCGEF